jgi:hypothetical protein
MLGHVALRTPAKAPLVLPTRLLALAIAAEWECQSRGKLKPHTMPLTSLAATALDQVRCDATASRPAGRRAAALAAWRRRPGPPARCGTTQLRATQAARCMHPRRLQAAWMADPLGPPNAALPPPPRSPSPYRAS